MRETELEWFRPMWRRLLVTGFIAAWLLYEAIFVQDQFWIFILGAALAYAVWHLFIQYDKRMGGKSGGGESSNGDGKPPA